MKVYTPVKALKDDSGHWYIIPNELESEFYKDLENEEFVAYGDFGSKWDQYRTGGNLNLVQLYVESDIS